MMALTEKKKIAFVSHTSKLSGAAMSFYVLLSGLDAEKFTISPILPQKGPLFDKLNENGYRPEVVAPRKYLKWKTVQSAKKILLAAKIDLVYLSCTDKYCRIISAAAHSLKIPIVWHVREPPLGNRVQKSLRLMKKYNAKAIAVSQEQYDVLVGQVDVEKVDNGVDPQRFDRSIDGSVCRKDYGLAESDFVFGIVGTIEKRKNVKDFLIAAGSLSQRYDQARFIVVGSGDANYIEEMKALVAANENLREKVIFTGSVWNVAQVMSAMNVLVMPSNWEAFPRVVIEGMTMGLPVIATDVGDVSYIIDNEVNGFVIPKGDQKALALKMEYCLNSRGALEELAENAYDKASRMFSQNRHVEIMEGHFNSMMSAQPVT